MTIDIEERLRADADVIGYLSEEEAESLILKAKRAGFEVRPKVEVERLRATGTLRFRRGRFQLDLILASMPFEESAYQRAKKKKLFGRMLRFPAPEDLILFKVLAGREKDMLDASGIVRRHTGTLDMEYLEGNLRTICDQAEDMGPWNRLQEALKRASSP